MIALMRRWVALVVLLVVLPAGCGPIAYVNQVTRKADDAVEAARVAKCDELAPYWYTRAVEYLHMAREVAAHADYQGANRFGRLAEEAALKAVEEAGDPSKRPIELDKAVAPAKDGQSAPAKGGPVAPAKDTP